MHKKFLLKILCLVGLGLSLPLTLPLSGLSWPAGETVTVHFFDVGYGDAILVQMPANKALLIDTGEKEYAPTIIQHLRSRDIQELDALVITHPHANHWGGMEEIANHIKIQRVVTNGERADDDYHKALASLEKKGAVLFVARKGEHLDGLPTDISLEVLHPLDLSGGMNENSLVLLLKFKEVSFLSTGDIGEKEQNDLIETFPFLKEADCVQIPHHGGPIDERFVEFFQSPIFIISTGDNPWGWPQENEVKKIRRPLLRTDHHGPITLESDGKEIQIKESKSF